MTKVCKFTSVESAKHKKDFLKDIESTVGLDVPKAQFHIAWLKCLDRVKTDCSPSWNRYRFVL